MSKLLLKDVKPDAARILSMASTDSRVVDYINEAQERLMYKGKWPGTYIRYDLKQSNGAITWPRQLETVEAVSVSGSAGVIRDSWFEFLESGPGLLDKAGGDSLTLVDRGEAPCFSDISTSDSIDKKIRIKYKDLDNGKSIILQGYDEDGTWIRSNISGTVIDGEKLTFDTSNDALESGTGYRIKDTAHKFQTLSSVVKDVTNYEVKLFEIEATGTVSERAIAQYEPSETKPHYRRSLIPGLADDNTTVTVTIVGKARFIPAVVDDDWLHINIKSAIKEMIMSISLGEKLMTQESMAHEARAESILQDYLMHYIGDGTVVVPRIHGTASQTAAGVENLQ